MSKVTASVLLTQIKGRAGSVVFSSHGEDISMKPFVAVTDANTAAQRLVRNALGKAAKDFRELDSEHVKLWQRYAENIVRHDPVTKKPYKATAISAFTQLASKFYVVNPTGTAPTVPPTSSFDGDSIVITATADAGKVTFTASGANSANVTVEFLLQPLVNANRKPQTNGYRSKGFFHFVTGTLSHDVTVPAGFYAAGYRFVNTATGQATFPVYLPVQTVALSLAKTEKGSKAA